MAKGRKKLKIIPLGGLGEIGKNITVFEYGEDIIVVDCGMAFPDDEMLGIDLVLPDTTYLAKNKERVKGIVLTHGHEDHIGALPYVLRDVNVPVYGTRLTLGLLEYKLEEHGMLSKCHLQTVTQGQTINLGVFRVEFIRSTHSIADAVALAIHTPIGIVVHTSDFKVDYTPISGESIDLARFAELGKKGVMLLMCDSTNVERPGYTMSERTVGETFEEIFMNARSRILVATFASNIHRVQQVVNAAAKYGRKVAICGRSMVNVSNKAIELGYLTVPEGMLVDIDKIKNYRPEQLVIVSTGSQGEPMSALTRMALGAHRQVEIAPGDLVVISATPIPGNEKSVSGVINELFRKGADVIYEALADIHVSGHACQEELKLMHRLVNPKFFLPVHGEYRHLRQHANLAQGLGMEKERTLIMEIGQVLEINSSEARIRGTVPSGKVLVDGLGIGDVGNVVLRDRKHLSEDGLIIVVLTIQKETSGIITGPDIISRGFVYMRESEAFMDEVKQVCKEAIAKCQGKNCLLIKNTIKDILRDYLYHKTKRNPMILPIIMEI
ncbi:ribonuclease J [Anaerobacterium chartisolvens]|uniref:Ribonuclease J n=1 Tax=Anaerobacterium chartisolvens TaxID=1297424 RepID=A0A369AZ74_9FIRM|nr:ribonuclease J [Anaerobacterium chartisolvens]RCX13487.1 ribonuclease J [Anaerobacterium chartisolvens]